MDSSANGSLKPMQVPSPGALLARTERLIVISLGFIVLPGESQTLAKLAAIWAHAAAGGSVGRVVLLDRTWSFLAEQLASAGRLEPAARSVTLSATNPEQAVGKALGA